MLLDKSSKLPADFFTPHKDDLKHTFVIGPTRLGMSDFAKAEVEQTQRLLPCTSRSTRSSKPEGQVE